MKYISILFLIATLSSAQTPGVQWTQTFGGLEAESVVKTNDGGFLLAGYANQLHPHTVDYHGSVDGLLIKLSSALEIEWSKCYGTAGDELINKIIHTSDGGYIFVGKASAQGQGFEFWIVKIDTNGNVVWEKKYGYDLHEEAFDIVETAQGDYIITGHTSGATFQPSAINFGYDDFLTMKVDSEGEIIYSVHHGGESNDRSYSLVANDDGTVIIAGSTQSDSGEVIPSNSTVCESAMWLIKLNLSGGLVWQKHFTSDWSGANYFNAAHSIIKTQDGGLAIAGQGHGMINASQGSNFCVIKTDINGNLQWRETYGGTGNDIPYSIKQTMDGGYVVAGYSNSNNVDIQTIIPHSSGNAWVLKLGAQGALEWQKSFGSSGIDRLEEIVEINSDEYFAVGESTTANYDNTGNSGLRFYAAKFSNSSLEVDTFNYNSLNISQNLESTILRIQTDKDVTEFSIYDALGKCVMKKSESNITQIDISSIQSGLYIIQFFNGRNHTKKFIKN